MTITQTVMWTALPNGIVAGKGSRGPMLRLSVFASPRLETTAPMGILGSFPDFESTEPLVNWAASINAMHFDVDFKTSPVLPRVRTVRATKSGTFSPEPALWDSFFGPEMPIKQFKYIDLSAAKINTFPAKSVFSLVKTQYAGTAALPKLVFQLPLALNLVKLPGILNPPLIHVLPTPVIQSKPGLAALTAAAAPVQNLAFTKFEDFHTPYVVPEAFTPPPIPEMDFHKACTALGNYPALMRRLGLVVDLEIPYTSALAGSTLVRVRPVWADARPARGHSVTGPEGAVTCIDASQWTAVTMATSKTKSTVSKFWPAAKEDHVRDGYLVARNTSGGTDPTSLFNVDVDVAASRMIATAIQISDVLDLQLNPERQVASRPHAAAAASSSQSDDQIGLPGLGQPMVRLAVTGLATRVTSQAERFKQMNDRIVAGTEDQSIVYAEDINRGYRVDVWDDVTRIWHSLSRRRGTYSIGETAITWDGDATYSDEGWIQLSAISAPEQVNSDEAPEEMRIHESLFDWTGWSLAVPRPGAALSEPDESGNTTVTKTFVGPDGAEHPIGHYLHPMLPLDTSFKVPTGTLPRMRFGVTYRFRARTVDLAGNSIAFSEGTTTSDPGGSRDKNELVTRAITHKRYDPVKPPDIIMSENPKPSESPYIVVVRSYTDPTTKLPTTQNTLRHIAPPRIAVSTAEVLGGLDGAGADKPMDKALWETLCDRDAWEPPKNADGSQQPQPTIPSPVKYLPDLFSRGAALANLPGVAAQIKTRSLGTGAKISGVKISLGSSKVQTVATTRIAFDQTGAPWYDKKPFDLSISGVAPIDTRITDHGQPNAPEWDDSQRILGVELPKAEELTVGLSSYAKAADLTVMGVYQWGLEAYIPTLLVTLTPKISRAAFKTAAAASIPTATKFNAVPVKASKTLSPVANTLIDASLIGQNWMLTPQVNMTFVHAVDKPLIRPIFTGRAHFERKAGETHATLVDWMQIHGKSTSKFEVKAAWTEGVDDTSAGVPLYGPTAVKKAAHVFSLTLAKTDERVLNGGTAAPVMKSVAWGNIPAAGMLINSATPDLKPQRQFFGDTKHRRIDLTAVATSRFEKYFNDIEGVTTTIDSGAPKILHVPSAARPAKPEVAYILPTFGWTRAGTTSTRTGGGLRVYVKRPWFTSGDDELLGVVLWYSVSGETGFSQLSPYVTHWGRDPLYVSPSLPSTHPALSNFKRTTRMASGLYIPEYASSPVQIAGYTPEYDAETDMWFADVVIDQGKAYLPFVKLGLCRYQPYSLPGLELSTVTAVDFVQLTPDRFASATLDPTHSSVEVMLSGHTYSKNSPDKLATITATVERAYGTVDEAAGWTPITGEIELDKQSISLASIIAGHTESVWRGTVQFTPAGGGARHRVTIREYEWFARYQSTAQKRLVYAETITLSV